MDKKKVTTPSIKVDWNKLFDVSDCIGWKEDPNLPKNELFFVPKDLKFKKVK